MTAYLDPPPDSGPQDDVDGPSLFAMRSSWADEVAWCDRQVTNPSQDWTNLCQSFARQAVGAAAWAPSAWDAWRAIPSRDRILERPTSTSTGIAYYGKAYPGHAVPLDGLMCWSNDIKRRGKIDRVPWDVFLTAWGMPYLGRIMVTPSGPCPTRPSSSTPPAPSTPAPTLKGDPLMFVAEVKYGSNATSWWLVSPSGMVNLTAADAGTFTGPRLKVTNEAEWRRIIKLSPQIA